MKKTSTIYEQIIITSERTRELRQQRYGSMDTGVFSPRENKKLPRTVDTAINEFHNKDIGREYITRAIERVAAGTTRKKIQRRK